MSSNTNIGNTPVNQGYVQLVHMGETGGIDGTLRTLYDGDGTASDLQIASNKVKINTELYIGSKTATEYIQDIVGAMLTSGSYTNITTTYDDANGNIDLSASGEVTLTGSQTLTNKTFTSPVINTGVSGSAILDSDTMSGVSATTLSSSESIKAYVDTEVAGLVDSAPDNLNTLNELAAALDDNADILDTLLVKSANLSDLTNATTARSNLGLGSGAVLNTASVTNGASTLSTGDQIYDFVLGLGYTTNVGDITGVDLTGGTGISIGSETNTTSGAYSSTISLSHLGLEDLADPNDDRILFWDDSVGSGKLQWLDIGSNISISGSTISATNTTYVSSDFTHDDLIGFVANEHIDWTSASAGTIHASNYTDTNTNQLTTFDVTGDSGTDQTIAHGNTLDIAGGTGIATVVGATDTITINTDIASTSLNVSGTGQLAINLNRSSLSTATLDASDTLILFDNDDSEAPKRFVAQDIFDSISGITIDGTTANGVLTYGGTNNIDTEANLTFDGSTLTTAGVVRNTNNANVDGPNFNVSTTNKTTAEYAYRVDRSGSVVGGILIDGKGSFSDLNVVGTSTTDALIIDGGGTYAAGSIYSDSNWGMLFRAKQASPGQAEFRWANSADSELMRIDTSGNVGIGTTSPGTKLEVKAAGDTSQEVIKIRNSSGTEVMTIAAIDGSGDGYINFNTSPGTINTNGGDLVLSPGGSGNVIMQPTKKLYLDGGGNTYIHEELADQITFSAGGGNYFKISPTNGVVVNDPGADVNFRVESNNNAHMLFVDGGQDRVGIGTNSPNKKLEVAGGFRISETGDSSDYLEIGVGADATTGGTSVLTNNGSMVFGTTDSSSLIVRTNNTEAMRIDTSQNVGIGTDSPDANLVVASSSGATIKLQDTGSHAFSLVCENNSNFLNFKEGGGTSILSIDGSNQRVGIGVTNPDAKLEVTGGTNSDLFSLEGAGTSMKLVAESGNASSSNVMTYRIGMEYLGTYTNGFIDFYRGGGGTDGYLTFGTSGTEKMRIDGSGNVGIGGTPVNFTNYVNLDVKTNASGGGVIGFHDSGGTRVGCISHTESINTFAVEAFNSHPMTFLTNNAEAMRIDSSQRVGIGTNSPSSKLHVSGGDSRHSGGKLIYEAGGVSDYFRIQRSSSSGRSQIQFATETTSEVWRVGMTGGGGEDFVFWDGSANVLILDRSNNQAQFNNDVIAYYSSDKRLKENVKNIENPLEKLNKINGVEFDWIKKEGIHGNKGHDIGVIAQEIEEVLPEVVTTRDNGYKAVKYEKIVPLLIEAIKEQQEQIDELRKGNFVIETGD